MKKWLFRLFLALCCVVGATLVGKWRAELEQRRAAPVEFRFTESMYYETARRQREAGLARLDPEELRGATIGEVFISGEFSGWSRSGSAYRMQTIGRDRFAIEIDLQRGVHPYKFVVHARREERQLDPFWCTDFSAEAFRDDGYGGLNSLVTVENAGPVRFVFDRAVFERQLSAMQEPGFRRLAQAPVPPVVIERVHLSGRFSDWDPVAAGYEMQKREDGAWQLALELEPGRHPYKFVVFHRRADRATAPLEAYWCEDTAASESEADGFGGRNSIRVVEGYRVEAFLLEFSLYAIAIGLLVFSLLEGLLHASLRVPLSLRYKLLFVMVLPLLVSNLAFLLHAHNQGTGLVRKLVLDSVNLVHAWLRASGVTPGAVSVPGTGTAPAKDGDAARAASALERLFSETALRQDYQAPSNTKQPLNRVFLLDPEGRIIAYGMERSLALASLSYISDQPEERRAYYAEKVAQVFAAATAGGRNSREPFFSSWEDYPVARYPHDEASSSEEYESELSERRFFSDNLVLVPILGGFRLRGWYLANFSPRGYSALLAENLRLNVALLVVLLVLFILLVGSVARVMLRPLAVLIEGIDHVKEGNLEYRLAFDTGDEIAALGQSYNYMREKLLLSRNELAGYTTRLEERVRERTAALARANRSLREADRARSRFFTNLAHETRTPLTLVRNYLDACRQRLGAVPELDVLQQHTAKLERDMINCLDAEKLARGQEFYDHTRATELSAVVRDKLALLSPAAETAGLAVSGMVEPGIVVQADPLAVDRVLNNLLDNAVKYTPAPGSIVVRVERKGKKAQLIVEDSGRGISREELPRIFRPYHQVAAKKRSLQGIGMGLAIVAGIVRGAGGRIGVESEEGRGSRFTVSLRLAPPGVAGEAAPADLALPFPPVGPDPAGPLPARADAPLILVVEDNPDLRRLVCRELAQVYAVTGFASAEAALGALENDPLPDLVVSDVMLDGLDGFALFEQLAATERTRGIPFIFLTARAALDDRLRGLGEGALDYIVKPFSMAELKARVGAILRYHHLRRELHAIDKYAALGRLVAGITHEIFNPFFGVRGLAEYLESHPQAEDRDTVFRQLFENLGRIESLIRSLRLLSAGRGLQAEALALRPIIESVVALLSGRIREGVAVEVAVADEVRINADRDALTRILLNLAANALDAVGERGRIRIAAAMEDGRVRLTVADDGPGIDAADRERVFEPFWTTKAAGEGTGLGLFLVKDLAERLGWRISVSPGEERGTVFTLLTARGRNGDENLDG